MAASTTRARAQLRDSLGRYAQVTVNQQTGGLQAVGRLNGYLTGASSAERDRRSRSTTCAITPTRSASTPTTSPALQAGARLQIAGTASRTCSWDAGRRRHHGRRLRPAGQTSRATAASIDVLGGARGELPRRRSSPARQRRRRPTRRAAAPSARGSSVAGAALRPRTTGAQDHASTASGQAALVAYHGDSACGWPGACSAGRARRATTTCWSTRRPAALARRSNASSSSPTRWRSTGAAATPGGTQTAKPIDQLARRRRDPLRGETRVRSGDVRDEVGRDLTEDRASSDTFDPSAGGDVPPSSGDDWLYPITSVPDPTGACSPRRPAGLHVEPHDADAWQINDDPGDDAAPLLRQRVPRPPAASPIAFNGRRSGNFEAGRTATRAARPTTAPTPGGCPTPATSTTRTWTRRPTAVADDADVPVLACGRRAVRGDQRRDDAAVVYHEYTHGLS